MGNLALPEPPPPPSREALQAAQVVLHWLCHFHNANSVEWYALMATRAIVADAIDLTFQ